MMMNYISIELANEAGEIVVLKIFRKQILSENGRVPNNERCSSIIPRNYIIGGDFIHEVICLGEKRCWSGSLRVDVMFPRWSHAQELICGDSSRRFKMK